MFFSWSDPMIQSVIRSSDLIHVQSCFYFANPAWNLHFSSFNFENPERFTRCLSVHVQLHQENLLHLELYTGGIPQ